MTDSVAGVIFAGSLLVALVLVHRPLGDYLARVLGSPRHLAVERGIYRISGVDADVEQPWPAYLRSVLAFGAVGVLFLYAFLRLQQHFGQPYAVPAMPADRRGTPRSASSRTQTGSRTRARARSATSRRWPVSRCRTSCPPRSVLPLPSR